MKKRFLLLFCILYNISVYGIDYTVTSPDERLQLKISSGAQLSYQIFLDDQAISGKCSIGMTIRGKTTIGVNAEVNAIARSSADSMITVLFGTNERIEDRFNSMTLDFGEYNLICRAYNEGVAYRFETKYRGGIIIENELAEFDFPETPTIHLAYEEPPHTMSHWELPYSKLNSVDEFRANDYAITPIMFKNESIGLGITVAESDLIEYPGLYILRHNTDKKLVGKFAGYPDQIEGASIYDSQKVLTRFDYIANTKGARQFPWRCFIITHDDKELLNNNLIYKLASPQALEDVSWIKPGKTAWDWLHDGELEGVDFPAGPGIPRTLEFYKYYVDFAVENGLEYMTLDAGWDNAYIQELCQYASGKGVKIFVWTYFNFIIKNESMLDDFVRWGISGIKVDFIARDDQVATGWLTTMAKACAKRQLMIIMHGSAKPTGLHRAYPNILNYEGVVGEEHNKWNNNCSPIYRTVYPFLRLLGGPADITPGSLRNKTKLGFTVDGSGAPNSLGTRTQQMAMYVVNNQTLGFVSDAPTEYRKFPEVTNFVCGIPSVWDETAPLKAKIGEYLITARRSSEIWYVGGITNWTERKGMEINFAFLPEQITYEAYIMKDIPAVNNDNGFRSGDATACQFQTINVNHQSVLAVDFALGGGVLMRLRPISTGNSDLIANKFNVTYDNKNRVIHINTDIDKASVTLHDILGRKIKTFDIVSGDNVVSASDLNNGNYILSSGNKSRNVKLVLY